MLAEVLHTAGIDMGKGHFFPPPSEENPRGYFEDGRFRNLNDKLLEGQGYKVKSWSLDVPADIPLPAEVRGRMDRLLRRKGVWGWKDPRQCLTIDAWHRVLDIISYKPVYIYLYRNPASVANSISKRSTGPTYDRALDLWASYNAKALKFLEITDCPVHATTFDYIRMNGPDKLLAWLGVKGVNTFDGDLVRSEKREDLDGYVGEVDARALDFVSRERSPIVTEP